MLASESFLLQMTEEEKLIISRQFEHEGEQKSVEFLNGRRKSKKTYEYEVKWVNRRENKNSWLTRERCAFSPPLSSHGYTSQISCLLTKNIEIENMPEPHSCI